MKLPIKSSKEVAKEKHRWTIYGSFGSGKTTLAASASKHCPNVLPSGKPAVLSDMAWLQFDNGGVRDFGALGIEVPYVIDCSSLTTAELQKMHPDIMKQLRNWIKEAGVEWLVVDTVTSLNAKFEEFMSQQVEKVAGRKVGDSDPSKLIEQVNKLRQSVFFGGILNLNKTFFRDINSLPCSIIYLGHPKTIHAVLSPDATRDSKARYAATNLSGGYLTLSLTGKGEQEYIAHSDVFAALDLDKDTRTLYLGQNKKGYEVRSRLSKLDAVEPNPHIRQLLSKAGFTL